MACRRSPVVKAAENRLVFNLRFWQLPVLAIVLAFPEFRMILASSALGYVFHGKPREGGFGALER